MGEFATGVTVITTNDDEGHPHSMTANSFTSVCLDPPVVLVCVAHGTNTYGFLESTGRFGVNILSQDQQELGALFAKKPEDREEGLEYHYTTGEVGVPILDGSMVFFGCEVMGSHVYGDHTIYMGAVKEMRRNEAEEPLMFFRSRWYNPGK
ncbi:MAG: hypothetical protein BZY75_01285 [SAR202 cluster bacterium Io17-Chloro-G7]|nr:MAG: hypothetical protein BZY75_01285 [SAR202 cluster bacterium Io17-Chloro-G7]